MGIVKTFPTKEGEEYVSQTSEIILKQNTGTGTVAQGPGGGEASNIWVKGVGEFQDTTSESSLAPCQELPCCSETENSEIPPPAQAGMDGESVSSLQSPRQDCSVAVSRGSALTPAHPSLRTAGPAARPGRLILGSAVLPLLLALDQQQKDALPVLLLCASKKKPLRA